MFCEIYRCNMTEAACFLRRRNATSKARSDIQRPGHSDYNCRACRIGEQIAARHDPGEVKKYSESIKQAMEHGREFYKMNKDRKKAGLDPLPVLPPGTTRTKRRGRPPIERPAPSAVVVYLTQERDFHRQRAEYYQEALRQLGGK